MCETGRNVENEISGPLGIREDMQQEPNISLMFFSYDLLARHGATLIQTEFANKH